MSVPTPQLGPTGYVYQDPIGTPFQTSDVLLAEYNDINTAFGGGLNAYSPAVLPTPEGQLATSVAAITMDMYDLFLYFVSQVDPLYALGSMQDAIGLLYFQHRFPATSTSGPCTCTGLPGTVIPTGAQAADTSGNVYVCEAGGTIPGGGSITLNFANQVTGPIGCPAGDLNKIYVATPGWSGVTNPADLTLGQNVESAQDFEFRRQLSVMENANSNTSAIVAAVLKSGANLVPPNVPSSVLAMENYTAGVVEMNGYSMLPNSIYIAVLGGDPTSIAEAILSKKNPGCNMNGNTTLSIQDPGLLALGQPSPYYAITFEEPAAVPIYFMVVLRSNPSLPPPNVLTPLIGAAIAAQFAPPNSSIGAIGSTVYASDFSDTIAAAAPGVKIISVQVGGSFSLPANYVDTIADQYPDFPVTVGPPVAYPTLSVVII